MPGMCVIFNRLRSLNEGLEQLKLDLRLGVIHIHSDIGRYM